uniref:Palmitoyltransferase n=1 Tax=Angiostrongylus cantonensis TaxID=6313 RepID=A0A0K0CU28_ANGCA
MSWYSVIYTRVREYSEKNPICGFFLARLLNVLLVMQLLGLVYSFYVYIYIVCGRFLQSPLQATFYLCVYSSLVFMALWSLFSSFRPPMVISAMDFRYCYMCMSLKPDRAHHCSSCGRCVVKFDHHCPWINQCVNYTNYKQFLLYIFYSTLTVVWFLITSLECFVRFILNANWLEDSIPFSLLLTVMVAYGVFGYYPLGEMLVFHFGLISMNETTCEQAKPSVLKFDFKADYNLGREKNFMQVFGWGLWLFPLNTSLEDGIHFEIRYEILMYKSSE